MTQDGVIILQVLVVGLGVLAQVTVMGISIHHHIDLIHDDMKERMHELWEHIIDKETP